MVSIRREIKRLLKMEEYNNSIICVDRKFMNRHWEICDEKKELQEKLDDYNYFLTKLIEKVNELNASVYTIKNDGKGMPVFVCVVDKRTLSCNKGDSHYLSGDVDFFILTPETVRWSRGRYNHRNFPFMETAFSEKFVTINELHCDNSGVHCNSSELSEFENRGYATMMLDALLDIIVKEKKQGFETIQSIGGMLYFGDVKTEFRRKKRNAFYLKRGFIITDNKGNQNEDTADGHFQADVVDLLSNRTQRQIKAG